MGRSMQPVHVLTGVCRMHEEAQSPTLAGSLHSTAATYTSDPTGWRRATIWTIVGSPLERVGMLVCEQ